jgi:hypothetical protein
MKTNSDQTPLDEALASLRRDYNEVPPAHVESFLMGRVTAKRQRMSSRTRGSVAALAAALMLLTWLVIRPRERQPYATSVSPERQLEHPRFQPELIPDLTNREAVSKVRQPRKVQREPGKIPVEANPEAAASAPFLAIPYAEPFLPSEQLDVYRVQLPRATLRIYGFPAQTGDLEASVLADVAVGSDGVVRAVRFVH